LGEREEQPQRAPRTQRREKRDKSCGTSAAIIFLISVSSVLLASNIVKFFTEIPNHKTVSYWFYTCYDARIQSSWIDLAMNRVGQKNGGQKNNREGVTLSQSRPFLRNNAHDGIFLSARHFSVQLVPPNRPADILGAATPRQALCGRSETTCLPVVPRSSSLCVSAPLRAIPSRT